MTGSSEKRTSRRVAEARKALAADVNRAANYLRSAATELDARARRFRNGDQTAVEFVSEVQRAVLNTVASLGLMELARAGAEVDGTREEERRG